MFAACRLLATAAVSLLCFANAHAAPKGFLAPFGGGPVWLDEETGTPTFLETRIKAHRRMIATLREQIRAGAQLGSKMCAIKHVVSPTDEPDYNQKYFQYTEESFILAGWPQNQWLNFEFVSRRNPGDATDALNIEQTRRLATECGLVHLPAGDQAQMMNLWKGTPLEQALIDILRRGGGLAGNSAGAALLGSVGFYPGLDNVTSTRGLLEMRTRNRSARDQVVMLAGFLTAELPKFPPLYVETHVDPRERMARSLALMAAWEDDKPLGASRVVGMGLDIDVGTLILWSDEAEGWTAEVIGGRTVEFVFPQSSSAIGWPVNGFPYYTNGKSHLLLEGGVVALSGPRQGQVLRSSTGTMLKHPAGTSSCTQLAQELVVRGDSMDDAWEASEVHFEGIHPTSGQVLIPDEFRYSPGEWEPNLFRSGHLRIVRESEGCGYWQPFAYNDSRGHVRDRQAMLRYVLGSGNADFSVALPYDMVARFSEPGKAIFESLCPGCGASSYRDSSIFVYDVRAAVQRGVPSYVYDIYGGIAPFQTGAWEGGLLHLLPPGGSFDTSSGRVDLPQSFVR